MDFNMRKMLSPLLVSCMLTAAPAGADSGREIAQKAQAAQFAFKTLKASGEMTLTRGRESIGQRTFTIELIEEQAETAHDKARITITAPTALKDTQLISWSSGSGEDQQWLVTPRTQRVQRIADRGRQAAFVSSDFSYEDILKWQVDDYEYAGVSRGACPAGTCTVVEAKPRNRYSSYTLLKVYYDDTYRISRIDYFGSDAAKPRKTLEHSNYVKQGNSWQPSRSMMTNHETETSTQIVWSGYQIDMPINERVMSPSTIGR
jgi:outer membrane lipoprotein-sorting protein